MTEETITLTGWQSISIDGYREAEYARDYYYENGVLVGTSEMYYTGNYR